MNKTILINKEVACVDDCLELAQVSFGRGNVKYTKLLLEDALKSINEIERLRKNETAVLIGTILNGRNGHGKH